MNDKPIRPKDSDCCGSGCRPCIFDIYEERLKKWELKKESVIESNVLDQIKYLPFLIINITDLEVLKVFQFQAIRLKRHYDMILISNAALGIDYEVLKEFLNINPGEYLIMKGNHENETISRSYTPVLDKDSFEKGIFTVVISLQANGKMSQFVRKLNTKDIVFWRGPYQEFTHHNFKLFKHVLLFGGGTGVVPLYNIAKSIVEDDECETWVHVHICFRKTNTIVLRNEFRRLMDFWNFKMNIYITDQNQSDFNPNYNESITFRKIDKTVIGEEIKKCGNEKFFTIICGPEGFNHFVRNNFKKLSVDEKNIFTFW